MIEERMMDGGGDPELRNSVDSNGGCPDDEGIAWPRSLHALILSRGGHR